MKKSHFTETQILAPIQKHEKGIAINDIVREMGLSEQTFYNWEAEYGGMQAIDIKKLRDLELELVSFPMNRPIRFNFAIDLNPTPY